MLVLYDQNGVIRSCILQHAITLEVLAQKYAEQGIPHLMCYDDIDIVNYYVDVSVPKVMPKPTIEVTGDIRQIAADGVDTLTFGVTPSAFSVTVLFEDKVIFQADDTDGTFEFAVDHAGTYRLVVQAAPPYKPAYLTIEAI